MGTNINLARYQYSGIIHICDRHITKMPEQTVHIYYYAVMFTHVQL